MPPSTHTQPFCPHVLAVLEHLTIRQMQVAGCCSVGPRGDSRACAGLAGRGQGYGLPECTDTPRCPLLSCELLNSSLRWANTCWQ